MTNKEHLQIKKEAYEQALKILGDTQEMAESNLGLRRDACVPFYEAKARIKKILDNLNKEETVLDLAKVMHSIFQKHKHTAYRWENLPASFHKAICAQAQWILENYERKTEH